MTQAFAKNLLSCVDASSAICSGSTHGVNFEPQQPSDQILKVKALNLVSSFCLLLDPERNKVARLIADEHRVLACRVRDQINYCAENATKDLFDLLLNCYGTLWKVLQLLTSLQQHSLTENRTITLALDSSNKGCILPKPFKNFEEYVFFYRFQEFQARRHVDKASPKPYTHWDISDNINHYIRIWQAVSLIEMLFVIIRHERPDEKIRWLDLGCSTGLMANLVRPEDRLPDRNWEIIGVDWNSSSVRVANERAGAQRTFLVGDAKEAIEQIGGGGFNIISAFEVVEHLEDPVKTIGEYTDSCADYFIAGSPRSERQGWLPVKNHIWSFDRVGFEEIFRAAGLTPTFANEAIAGGYFGGIADWLTVICGHKKMLPSRISAVLQSTIPRRD